MKIIINVPGVPVGKARPRVTRHGTYTPQKTKNYEALIRNCWKEQSGKRIDGDRPLKMTVMCFFPIPKSYSKKLHRLLPGRPHNKMPDLDNCIKSASDGLQGYAFDNDSCIFSIEAFKVYSHAPRMRITIEDVEQIEEV
jgi:Holliday junction resolvase RusA-like endonuclease